MTTEDWFASTKRPRTGPTSSFTSTSCATGKRCATNGRTSTASSRLFWRRRERHSPSPRLWTRWSGAKDPKTIRALALVRRQRRVEWLKFIKGVQVTSDNLFPTRAEKTNRLFLNETENYDWICRKVNSSFKFVTNVISVEQILCLFFLLIWQRFDTIEEFNLFLKKNYKQISWKSVSSFHFQEFLDFHSILVGHLTN